MKPESVFGCDVDYPRLMGWLRIRRGVAGNLAPIAHVEQPAISIHPQIAIPSHPSFELGLSRFVECGQRLHSGAYGGDGLFAPHFRWQLNRRKAGWQIS